MLGQAETHDPGLAAKNLGDTQEVQEFALPFIFSIKNVIIINPITFSILFITFTPLSSLSTDFNT